MRTGLAPALILTMIAAAIGADSIPVVNAVTATIAVGGGLATYGAQGVAVDTSTGLFYLGLNGNIVSGCDGDASVNGGTRPASPGAGRVSIVDPAQGKETASVASGSGVVWPQVDSYRGVVYVSNSGAGTVTVHDAATGTKRSTITVGGMPHMTGLDFTTRLMVVGNTVSSGGSVEQQNHASIVDTASGRVTRDFISSPAVHGVVVDQLRHIFYYTAVGNGAITAIDATTGLEIATGIPKSRYGSAFGNNNLLARQASSRLLFQTNSQAGASGALVVDKTTLTAKEVITFGSTGKKAWGLWVDEASRLLFAALPNSNEIGVADLDTQKQVASIAVGQCPYAVAVDPVRRIGLVSNQGSSSIQASASVFDLCPVYAATGRTVSGCSTITAGPSNLLGLADGNALKLAWKQTAPGGSTTRLVVGGDLNATLDLPSAAEFYDFANVPPGHYELTLVSTDTTGKSALSNTLSLSFPGTCSAPQTPSNVTLSKNGQSVTINWEPPSTGSAPTQYRLNVSGGLVGSYLLNVRSISGSVPAGSYTATVEAINSCGSSAPSAAQTVTIL